MRITNLQIRRRKRGRDLKSVLAHEGNFEMTDKITFTRFDLDGKTNAFQNRTYFNAQDVVLVNGNHFQAQKQIVVIDPKKNLQKRIDQLTDIGLILTTAEGREIPEVLKSANNPDALNKIPVLDIDDHEGVAQFYSRANGWKRSPVLKGLVLAGGRSTRMGEDKGKMNYHGKDQRIFMYEQLLEVCDEAFISIRADQEDELSDLPTVTDTFMGLGPYGAILSAFRSDPNAAWMVVACDQPLLDEQTLQFLKNGRNLSKVATCFHNPETDFPEPLIAIWEPRAYQVLLNFLSQGYSCPRKAMINSDCEVLQVPDEKVLKNANTVEESKVIIETILGVSE